MSSILGLGSGASELIVAAVMGVDVAEACMTGLNELLSKIAVDVQRRFVMMIKDEEWQFCKVSKCHNEQSSALRSSETEDRG